MYYRKDSKVNRVLHIYDSLKKGNIISKSELISLFNVNEKTIQRDLEDIRTFLAENVETLGDISIGYDRKKRGYSLNNHRVDDLTKEDVLGLSKILLESRAFCLTELDHLLNALLGQVNKEQNRYIKEIIRNERFNYVPLLHNKELLKKIWELSEYIRFKRSINITYKKKDGIFVERTVHPVSIIFSEFYFYLIADIDDTDYDMPTVYRIDRIIEYKETGHRFSVLSSERFEDGEFRKRVQFMFSGKLMKVKFEFWGKSIDIVLDRLPTAKVVSCENDKYLVEVEVYGEGIKMWILSQGSKIKVLAPESLTEEIKNTLSEMQELYK